MKTKFKVLEQKHLNDDKGYLIQFQSSFGDKISSWVSESDDLLLQKYYPDTIHVIEVFAYKDKDGIARLGLKLEPDVINELF